MDEVCLDVIVPEIIEILRKYIGDNVQVTHETRIFHDLMIFGGDACEFLNEVSEKYHIVKPVFDGSVYFPDEVPMLSCLIWIRPSLVNKWQPLTITDLATFVIEGIEANSTPKCDSKGESTE